MLKLVSEDQQIQKNHEAEKEDNSADGIDALMEQIDIEKSAVMTSSALTTQYPSDFEKLETRLLDREPVGSLMVNVNTDAPKEESKDLSNSKLINSKLLKKSMPGNGKKIGAKKLMSSDMKLESFESVERRSEKLAEQNHQLIDESGTGNFSDRYLKVNKI